MRYRIDHIPDGEAGTDATLKAIGRLIADAQRRPVIRFAALDALRTAGADSHSTPTAARALFDWVRRNIRYVHDPVDIETVAAPDVTLQIRAGDCDDQAALLAAMAASIGIPSRFKVIGPSRQTFQHIYAEINIGGRWIPVDTTIPNGFGRRPRLPVEKTYDLKGVPMKTTLSGPVTRSELYNRVYGLTARTLQEYDRTGRLTLSNLANLKLRAGAAGPFTGTVREAVKKAVHDYLPVHRTAPRPGLSGFFDDVWSGVQSIGSEIGDRILQGTGAPAEAVVLTPTIQLPSVTTQVSPGASATGARAAVDQILNSPITWIAAAAALVLIWRR